MKNELEITQLLNKMTKRELVSFAWDYTKGGDFSSLTKTALVKVITKKMIVNQRDEKINQLFS
jgi:hypothetical protein